MGRAAFVLSLTLNAGLLGLLVTAVLATALLEPGEEQMGWGLVWFFSLPLVAALSALSLVAHPRYLALDSPWRFALYAGLVVLVAALAPALFLLIARCVAP